MFRGNVRSLYFQAFCADSDPSDRVVRPIANSRLLPFAIAFGRIPDTFSPWPARGKIFRWRDCGIPTWIVVLHVSILLAVYIARIVGVARCFKHFVNELLLLWHYNICMVGTVRCGHFWSYRTCKQYWRLACHDILESWSSVPDAWVIRNNGGTDVLVAFCRYRGWGSWMKMAQGKLNEWQWPTRL